LGFINMANSLYKLYCQPCYLSIFIWRYHKIKELELYDKIDKTGETANKEAKKAKFRLISPLG
jgi:hypothetical protein